MRVPTSDAAPAADPPAVASLRAAFEAAEAAWNRGDAEHYGRFFTEDATYVGRAGHVFVGRLAIRDGHAEAFAGPFCGSQVKFRPMHLRFVTPDLAIVHLDVTTVQADGTDTHAVTTGLMQRTPDGWQMLTAHTSQV
jgi:uncharacterized protein (TIGR02246 family)